MDTSFGLSTIASLSLGISMSMTGSGRAVIESLSATELRRPAATTTPTTTTTGTGTTGGVVGTGEVARRRQSFQQLFNVGSMLGGGSQRSDASARRPSFVAILEQISEQNRLLDRCCEAQDGGPTAVDQPPRPSTTAMDKVPKEQHQTKWKMEVGKGRGERSAVDDGATTAEYKVNDRSGKYELYVDHQEGRRFLLRSS